MTTPESAPRHRDAEHAGGVLTPEDHEREARAARREIAELALDLAAEHAPNPHPTDDRTYGLVRHVLPWIAEDAARGTSPFSTTQLLAFFETVIRWMNLAGDWPEAVRALQILTAGGASPAAGERTRLRAVALGWLAWLHELMAQYAESRRAAERAHAEAERTGDPALVSQSLSRLAKTHRTLGYYEEALRLYRLACRSALASADNATLAAVFNSTGLTLWHLGRLEDALETLAQALRHAEATQDPRQQAQVLNNLGLVRLTLGAYAEARRDLQAALPLVEALPDYREMGVICGNLGEVLFHLGDDDRKGAREYQQSAARLAVGEAPSAYRSAKAKLRLSLLHRAGTSEEEWDQARILAREAAELGDSHGLHHFEILGRSYEAAACLELGRKREALTLSREAVRRLRRSLKRKQWLDGSPVEVLFLHHLVLAERAPRRAQAALRAARRQLEAQAAHLRDPRLRERFLRGIELHAKILAAAPAP